MKHDPHLRSAINLRYHPEIISICEKLGLKISFYNREEEPEDLRKIEGVTMAWGGGTGN